MMQLIDTHSHLFVEEFNEDVAEVVQRAKDAGVSTIYMPNIDVESLPDLLRVCNQYPDYLFPMLGLHPTSVDNHYQEALCSLKSHLTEGHPFVAIGEVGMDLYWDKTYQIEQQRVLDEQVQWALSWNLPLSIHCREAYEEMYEVLAPYKSEAIRGVFHCFAGNEEQAGKYSEFEHFFFGVNGCVTYKKSVLPEMLRNSIPLNRVVLETDAPYLAPVPHRGKRNESAFLVDVARKLSTVYEVELSEVSQVTTANAQILFQKDSCSKKFGNGSN